MMLLIRDAAAPNHPVIGIAALSSAAAGLKVRDEALGWDPETFIDRVRRDPPSWLGDWLTGRVQRRISELFIQDLLEDGVLRVGDVDLPGGDVIASLRTEAAEAKRRHQTNDVPTELKPSVDAADLTDVQWEEMSRTDLFRSKRAAELATLLEVRVVLAEATAGGCLDTDALLASGAGRRVVSRVLRMAKSEVMGTAIADLSVCGAVPPYSHLLAGKLVAMLAVGPEVTRLYSRRYGGVPSWIASGMAGRPLVRSADLLFIGTSSLYGVRPCQYDRISIPSGVLRGGAGGVRYRYLGASKGFGSVQFTAGTVESIDRFLRDRRGRGMTNRSFGEGASPRLRAIREGLELLGVPRPDEVLLHEQSRLQYGVSLVQDPTECLLGVRVKRRYLLPQRQGSKSSSQIAEWWVQRWLLPRVRRPGRLVAVQRETLDLPISHGARVRLPRVDQEQSLLFED